MSPSHILLRSPSFIDFVEQEMYIKCLGKELCEGGSGKGKKRKEKNKKNQEKTNTASLGYCHCPRTPCLALQLQLQDKVTPRETLPTLPAFPFSTLPFPPQGSFSCFLHFTHVRMLEKMIDLDQKCEQPLIHLSIVPYLGSCRKTPCRIKRYVPLQPGSV